MFLVENQGVGDCRTLQHGDDPPVWCFGDQIDENENWFTGEKLVCDSLSRFLVTFILQEITLGSRLDLCDEGLTALFESQPNASVPIWLDGPYVHGDDYSYYLWNDVLVARIGGLDVLGANHPNGITFLTENQGAVNEIILMMGQPWTLEIRDDGSARLRFLSGQTDENADSPPNTFDFVEILASLSAAASDQGHYERNAMVFFRRNGQSGGIQGKHLHDGKVVTSLCRLALERAIEPNKALEKRFQTEWLL